MREEKYEKEVKKRLSPTGGRRQNGLGYFLSLFEKEGFRGRSMQRSSPGANARLFGHKKSGGGGHTTYREQEATSAADASHSGTDATWGAPRTSDPETADEL